MSISAYQPLKNLNFNFSTCFLSGEELTEDNSFLVPVFPNWLMERYDLHKKLMQMMGGIRMMYRELLLPASPAVAKAIQTLDLELEEAFVGGYEKTKELDELKIFQFMARIMYGMLYHDFTVALEESERLNEPFKLSDLLAQKIGNLHLMLQSLIQPVVFENFKPWSMKIFQSKISKDILNYKDEPRKLNFCFGMQDFCIIACLQDNGEVQTYQKDVLDKIVDVPLHPAQIEEMYGRFMYVNYILREFPDYDKREEDGKLIFRLPDNPFGDLNKFAEWDNETYAKVIAGLWDPWGLPLEQVYDFPNDPISFVINEMTQEFIMPEDVNLPF